MAQTKCFTPQGPQDFYAYVAERERLRIQKAAYPDQPEKWTEALVTCGA